MPFGPKNFGQIKALAKQKLSLNGVRMYNEVSGNDDLNPFNIPSSQKIGKVLLLCTAQHEELSLPFLPCLGDKQK